MLWQHGFARRRSFQARINCQHLLQYRAAVAQKCLLIFFNTAGSYQRGVPLPPIIDAGDTPNMVTSSPFANPDRGHSRSAKTNAQRIFGSHQRYRIQFVNISLTNIRQNHLKMLFGSGNNLNIDHQNPPTVRRGITARTDSGNGSS